MASTKDPLNLNEWEAPICNIEDVCHDLGFDFYDSTEDPTLFDHCEKRD
jgi:hypothetical protein